MGKGFLILIVTFIVVGITHLVSMKMTKISETKKSSYRKVFWYFYGMFFLSSGVLNQLEKEAFS